MPVTVEWFNDEHTMIRYEFIGRWSWEELHDAIEQVQAMIGGVSHRVDILIDLSQNQGIPSGALTQMRGGTLRANRNWGMGVFIGTGTFIRALLNTFTRVYPKMGERYATADTLDDALRLIAQQRSRG